MMLPKQSIYKFVKSLLILCTFIRHSYLQIIASTQNALNKDLTFCIQNHTMSNTLQTFWHDANNDCELEAKSLINLYSQLLDASFATEDQCSALLKHHIRKKLIHVVSNQLEEAFVVQNIKTNRDLKQVLRHIQETDERVAQIIWERVLNEVYLFVAPEQLVNEIMLLKEPDLQIVALQSLFNRHVYPAAQHSATLIPLLTHHINSLLKTKNSSVAFAKSLQILYRRLPKELRFLYAAAAQYEIGLLNYHQLEYLYAPRDNGPDSERRVALTWIKDKNSTDSDGHLVVAFNDKGSVAFGNRFGASLKYLYADVDDHAAYFWIGVGLKSGQWWQVFWPHESYLSDVAGYIILQNDETKDLLCATREYDENRRYVTLLNAVENIENPACYWLVTGF